MMDDEFSPEIREAIERRVESYCSRRKVTKTESQMRNHLEGQTLDRFISVRAKMAHGATDSDVHAMVLMHVGKSNAALDHALHLHHRTANLSIEKELEIERAVGRVTRENSARQEVHMTALSQSISVFASGMAAIAQHLTIAAPIAPKALTHDAPATDGAASTNGAATNGAAPVDGGQATDGWQPSSTGGGSPEDARPEYRASPNGADE